MNQPVRITVLVENVSCVPGVLGEHGMAFWIEAGRRRVLFDTGQGTALEQNARCLGVRLGPADAIVLSHGHYDHTGEVEVCGMAVDRHPVAVKERIGVVPEESNLYPELTCRRNLEYLGELYGLSRDRKRARAGELLDAFNLADRADAPFRTLSRGMKRRLTVAAALVHSPPVVFLDEPTAGLDVPSARALRATIRDINRDGTTVFLTTHNLVEAESLCDRILILSKGRVVVEGTAEQIRDRVAEGRTLSLALSGDTTAERLLEACPAFQAASLTDGRWRLEADNIHAAVAQIASFADRSGLQILDITSAATSLEDAFVSILEAPAAEQEGKR